jgi:hypothetical protein
MHGINNIDFVTSVILKHLHLAKHTSRLSHKIGPKLATQSFLTYTKCIIINTCMYSFASISNEWQLCSRPCFLCTRLSSPTGWETNIKRITANYLMNILFLSPSRSYPVLLASSFALINDNQFHYYGMAYNLNWISHIWCILSQSILNAHSVSEFHPSYCWYFLVKTHNLNT